MNVVAASLTFDPDYAHPKVNAMTQAKTRLTFEEYLSLDAEDWLDRGLPEGRYEYVEGEVVELPPESRPNLFIANYLLVMLVNAGIPLSLVYTHACEIEVLGKPQTRYPDLIVLRKEHLKPTERRATITLKIPPPQLVAEVVSPGSDNEERDYEAKRIQYQERGIPEFWLIDPQRQTVTVLFLIDRAYSEVGIFQGDTPIASPTFPQFSITAQQILTAREELP